MSGLQISAPALAAISRGWAEAPAVTRRELLAAMTQATLLVEREVKEGIPRGATGLTAASVTSDAFSTSAGVLGIVGSSQPAALFVELGTKPHMPPVEALVPWVRAVLGVDAKRAPSVAFLIARKIARKGTKAQRPFALALARTEGQVLRMIESAADRIASHLAGGIA
ncbi:hypothetical protein BH10PSE18_BH10PSE18_19030 [soil metagenome]